MKFYDLKNQWWLLYMDSYVSNFEWKVKNTVVHENSLVMFLKYFNWYQHVTRLACKQLIIDTPYNFDWQNHSLKDTNNTIQLQQILDFKMFLRQKTRKQNLQKNVS